MVRTGPPGSAFAGPTHIPSRSSGRPSPTRTTHPMVGRGGRLRVPRGGRLHLRWLRLWPVAWLALHV